MWRRAKAVGHETFRTGDKILTDNAENNSPELDTKDILSKHVTESVQNLIGNLRGGSRKGARVVVKVTSLQKTKAKRARVIKKANSYFNSVTRHHVRFRERVSHQ